MIIVANKVVIDKLLLGSVITIVKEMVVLLSNFVPSVDTSETKHISYPICFVKTKIGSMHKGNTIDEK